MYLDAYLNAKSMFEITDKFLNTIEEPFYIHVKKKLITLSYTYTIKS